MQLKSWSYSKLTAWETCPRRQYETTISKAWPDTKNEAAIWGDTVHKALEYRMKHGMALPTWAEQWEPLVARLMASPAPVKVEHKIALNQNLQPVDYFAKDVWVRAIADVSIAQPTSIFVFDWKTGKYKSDTEQLRLSAAMQFSHFPHVEKASLMYAWLKDNRTTRQEFNRAESPIIWSEFLPRVERMAKGYEAERWEEKPSGLCRKYCPVRNCKFNGQ